MDVDWLQTFVLAAHEQNFRKTADKLHLAQPTVTLHIQKLEEFVGVQLFERRGRNVFLSSGGRRFLEHAKTILGNLQSSRDDMVRWQQGYAATVTIAVSPLVATTFLPHWIRGFSADHPAVEFRINVRESTDVITAVINGSSDIAFGRLGAVQPELDCTILYADPVVMVAPAPGHALEGYSTAADDLLLQHTVFTHNHPDYWDALVSQLRSLCPQMRTMHVSLVHVTTHLIGEKMGISFLPESTVRREILRGVLEEVPFPYFPLPVAHTYLITNSSTSVVTRQFADYVVDYMKVRMHKARL